MTNFGQIRQSVTMLIRLLKHSPGKRFRALIINDIIVSLIKATHFAHFAWKVS